MAIDLRAKPFYLGDEQIKWVDETLASMTDEDKLHQLFCLVLYDDNEEYCRYLGEKIRPGGFMNRVMSAEQCVSSVERMQKYSKIPLLVAANLETGGNGIVKFIIFPLLAKYVAYGFLLFCLGDGLFLFPTDDCHKNSLNQYLTS